MIAEMLIRLLLMQVHGFYFSDVHIHMNESTNSNVSKFCFEIADKAIKCKFRQSQGSSSKVGDIYAILCATDYVYYSGTFVS